MRKFFIKRNLILSVFVMALAFTVIMPRPANALCEWCVKGVVEAELQAWVTDIQGGTYWRLTRFVRSEMTGEKIWLISILWEDNILPAMMLMADQLTAVAMQQMQIIGTFMDAKHQLETQQVLQKIAARTHKDYQPSIGLCEFGTLMKSMAMTDRKVDVTAVLMAQHSQDRQLGAVNTASALGEDSDKESRIKQFREQFCQRFDNNDGLNILCDWDQDGVPGPIIGGQNPDRRNKDIDFVRTLDKPWTVHVDMLYPSLREVLTDDEEEVFALASNLYGHELFIRPPARSLQALPNQRITNMQKTYMDIRSVVAKRAVAENSFNAIVGLKSNGAESVPDYLIAMLQELGLPYDVATQMSGGALPSYYSQMEVLTKKVYQKPDFYTNLYDTPANVDRKEVAMQAVGLMQKFDIFKSYLRNEASLSVLLEMEVVTLQNEVENEINQMTGEKD
ncbi:MAG TPA: hypothetical protein PKX38_02605 [Alphaproteobacteria bacterium]|nr:hypothetical protein [Alphaproteobacteria bacterium]